MFVVLGRPTSSHRLCPSVATEEAECSWCSNVQEWSLLPLSIEQVARRFTIPCIEEVQEFIELLEFVEFEYYCARASEIR